MSYKDILQENNIDLQTILNTTNTLPSINEKIATLEEVKSYLGI